MKSTTPIRIQLTVPDEQQRTRRSSFDFNTITSLLSPSKPKITTNLCSKSLNNSLDKPRLSTVSSSYAQFLKQRDMDKSKKIVS